MSDHDPDAQLDAALQRTNHVALLALARHPQRERAIEILEQGGWLFTDAVGNGRYRFMIGWFDDPRMRPPDADKVIVLLTAPRSALLGGNADA